MYIYGKGENLAKKIHNKKYSESICSFYLDFIITNGI